MSILMLYPAFFCLLATTPVHLQPSQISCANPAHIHALSAKNE